MSHPTGQRRPVGDVNGAQGVGSGRRSHARMHGWKFRCAMAISERYPTLSTHRSRRQLNVSPWEDRPDVRARKPSDARPTESSASRSRVGRRHARACVRPSGTRRARGAARGRRTGSHALCGGRDFHSVDNRLAGPGRGRHRMGDIGGDVLERGAGDCRFAQLGASALRSRGGFAPTRPSRYSPRRCASCAATHNLRWRRGNEPPRLRPHWPIRPLRCPQRGRSRLGAARRRVMTAHRPLSEQVAIAERRLEVRRARARRHWYEVQADWQRGARWAPLLGVAAMAWLGYTLARQQDVTPALAAPSQARAGAASLWVTLAALAGSALRFAVSPPGRALWNAWRQGRAGR